jgi:hypothetical protein
MNIEEDFEYLMKQGVLGCCDGFLVIFKGLFKSYYCAFQRF